MPDLAYKGFQETVDEYLVRHRSILDVLSKMQESNARVNRAIVKAVTGCGCLKVNASRQEIPSEASFQELKEFMDTHLRGALCESCREVVEAELGRSFFYLVALCTLLGFEMDGILGTEEERLRALGPFSLN